MKKLRFLILTYFFKPYLNNFNIFLKKLAPIINMFKYIRKFKIILLLISIWRFHGFIYTFAMFIMVLILGFNIPDFFDVLAVIYKDFTVYFLEFKLISKLYDKFNIKSVEKVIKDVETQIEKSKVNRLQVKEDSKNKSIRPEYVTNPRPSNYKFNLIDAIFNNLISSKDIYLNNLFYFIVLFFLGLLGIHYHNEVSTTGSTILDWLFNRKPGDDPRGDDSDSINLGDDRPGLVNGVSDDLNDTSPVIDSNRVTESWDTPSSSSPSSTGSNTPTGPSSSTGSNTPTTLGPIDPRQLEFDHYFRDPI